ncbi:porin [Yoonia litorea]|uniref:Porin n=1 Tax=Yoonia litorea TaxID=1123755 RepID=A0A1I6MZL2_9RHOB|nr:porin [Yoonia litorea]SFS21133.1 hypothetical protein SAMN05444714_2747 [Yoonia litorea]
MKLTTMMTAASLAALPGLAIAQDISFAGAEASFTSNLDQEDGSDFSSNVFRGSVEGRLNGQFIGQLDIASLSYSGSPSTFEDFTSATIHLGYEVSPGLAVGAYYVTESWNGGDFKYETAGVEVAYASGPFAVDAATGAYRPTKNDTFETDFLRIDAAYEVIDGLDLVVDFTTYSDNFDTELNIISYGARYTLDQGLYGEVSWTTTSGDAEFDTLSVEVGYAFEGGTTFKPRDWASFVTLY